MNSRQCKEWRFCPLCEAGILGIVNHKAELHRRAVELKEKGDESMGIERPAVAPGSQGANGTARHGDDWVLYPALLEFLTETRYTDGSSRRTGTITVFSDGGQVKASLNDRDLDRVAFVSATSLAGLLVILEEKLATSSADWRSPQPSGRRRK